MKTALLLGAGSSIAQAIARSLAQQGYALQLAARDTSALEPFASDLKLKYTLPVTLHTLDARAYASHSEFYENLPVFPEVIICAVGYLGDQPFGEKNWAEAENIIECNYTGPVSLLNIAAEKMQLKKAGIIIGISSVAGERGRASNYLYGSAKAGFTAYLSGLRNRLYPLGIRVITLKPGFVYSKMTEHLTLPPRLTASPEQVAKVVIKNLSSGSEIIYVKPIWAIIMTIIRLIPEFFFKKLKL
jgi:hypothetical protein